MDIQEKIKQAQETSMLQNILQLQETFKDDEDCLQLITNMLDNCKRYSEAIHGGERVMQLNSIRMEVKDFQAMATEFDSVRRSHHNACLASINMVNRLAKSEDLPEPFPFAEDLDRRQVADIFILPLCQELTQAQEKPITKELV